MVNPIPAIVRTLFTAWDEYIAAGGGDTVFLRAAYSPELANMSGAKEWRIEQGFAPYADDLRAAGLASEPALTLAPESADAVLIIASRFAEENKSLLARAWETLRPGGWLIVAQHNELGAKRLDGLVKQLGGEVAIVTKHHCRAVASRKAEQYDAELVESWKKGVAVTVVPGTPLKAAPGTFSWRKVDAGSALLAESLPGELAGQGADIAAGWGYLSWRLLELHPAIQKLHLYEAEHAAITLAKQNLAPYSEKTLFHWCDAARPLQEAPGGGFDWAVMNPPAHDILWSAPEMTAAMFREAAAAIRKGGKLWIVAGRHLPYERTLEALFSGIETLARNGEYKVIEAVK